MKWTTLSEFYYRDSTSRFDVMMRADWVWVAYDCVHPRRGEFHSLTAAKEWCSERAKNYTEG